MVSDARMDAARERYGSEDYRAATGVMRQVFSNVVREQYDGPIARIRCPVTLVWGESDTAAPLAGAQRVVPLFHQAELVTLPGVGHLTPIEAPEALRRAVGQRLVG
jgi:pimeloyl-ACP methyl ester carboxylesterase